MGTTASSIRRWVTAALVVALVARLWWLGVQSVEYLHVDFGVYRMGGRALIDNVALYDTGYEINQLPFTYTPFAALAFVPLALLPWNFGLVLFTAVSVLALARVCWLLAESVLPRLDVALATHEVALGLLVVGLSLEPVVATLVFGQVNLVILWLVAEDLLGRRTSAHAGTAIGIATGIKLVPGIFIVYLLVIGRWRDALRAAAIAAVTVLAGFAAQPDQAWRYWTGVAYDSSRVGTVSYVSNQSLNGVLMRITGGGGRLVWMLLVVPVALAAFWTARRLHRAGLPLSAMTAIGLGSLLVSPVSWSHHWVWFVPIVASLAELSAHHRWTRWLVPPVVWLAWYAPMWWVPNDQTLEYGHGPLERVVANSYVLTAVALLGLLIWTAADARVAPSGVSAGGAPSSGRGRRAPGRAAPKGSGTRTR